MAFQQPTRQLPPRTGHVGSGDGGSAFATSPALLGPNESQTWVLFTPDADAGTATSYLSSGQDDQITPGRSRISDLGSLDTAARSEFDPRQAGSAVPSELIAESTAEEDAELDSLDSHLAEFRTVPGPYTQPQVPHAEPVFPGHDGLGSFRFEAQGINAEAQERLYAFERFNPNRVRRAYEGFDLAQLEMETEAAREAERNRRIEAWRLEQSRILLEDIRKETRRRRQSEQSLRKQQQQQSTAVQEIGERSVADEEAADINLAGTEWHEHDGPTQSDVRGGLWSRIARKVICDLMGIDDRLLAILFGEALPDDVQEPSPRQASDRGASAPASGRVESGSSSHDSAWQLQMLERVARELGMFVQHLSSHPGAFSTYARVQHTPLPYAGLPVIPEAPADVSEGTRKTDDSAASMPQFKPTVGPSADALGAQSSESATAPASAPSAAAEVAPGDGLQTFTQQEWEQDLDIRLVFRYLRSRFTSARPSSPQYSAGTSHLATSSTQDVAAKAARVRQHHPLVSHAQAHTHGYHRTRPPAERRAFKATAPSSPVAAMRHSHHHHHHPPGSCASQSTRRSARRSSISSRASSRHYWDIGGSIGTGSVITSTGPMGSWGEV